MIEVLFQKKAEGYIGFNCLGHAGFADAGEDIVCAGVSALVINTVNSLDAFTEEKFKLVTNEEDGLISVSYDRIPGHDAQLLLKSLVMGLQELQKSNGDEYIHIQFEEV